MEFYGDVPSRNYYHSELERSSIFNGKSHDFYGDVTSYVKLPEGKIAYLRVYVKAMMKGTVYLSNLSVECD